MVVGTEIHVSRFKSPPRGGGPGDSAPSAPSTNDQDQDVPLPTAPSPADSQDPAVIQTDETNKTRDENNETEEKKLNEGDDEGDENDSPNGEAPDTSISVDKETPSFINGRPTLKAGRRIITVNKPKSTNKVLSMEVGNPLVNKAGDLISLNINVNKGIKNRGRPKKSATTMSEMSDMRETRDKSKRSADAMSETNGISPEKKK